MTELSIEATGLVKSFGETRALRGVDLHVRKGTVHAVLGPNGAGKTTAVRILATLLRPDAGHARVYLPVSDSPALAGTGVRWELPTARFAVALHVGPHSDVDRSYAALGTYAAANGRDGAGPVRERYLTGPFDTADQARWRTEVCWPMAPAGAEAN